MRELRIVLDAGRDLYEAGYEDDTAHVTAFIDAYKHAADLIGKAAGVDIAILCESYAGHDAFAGQTVTPIGRDDEGSGPYETLEAALWQEIHDCIGTYVDAKGEYEINVELANAIGKGIAGRMPETGDGE